MGDRRLNVPARSFEGNTATHAGGAVWLDFSTTPEDFSCADLACLTHTGKAVELRYSSFANNVAGACAQTNAVVCAAATAAGCKSDGLGGFEDACAGLGSKAACDGVDSDSDIATKDCTFVSGQGDALRVLGTPEWTAVNVSYSDFDGLRTVQTEGEALTACDAPAGRQPCFAGTQCNFAEASAHCIPCQPNQASEDGYKCHLCQPGEHPTKAMVAGRPSAGGTGCVLCPAGKFSEHGICVYCGMGTQPNTYDEPGATGCVNCLNGTFSMDGVACVVCPIGTEPPQTSLTPPAVASLEIGPADCAVCPPTTYKMATAAADFVPHGVHRVDRKPNVWKYRNPDIKRGYPSKYPTEWELRMLQYNQWDTVELGMGSGNWEECVACDGGWEPALPNHTECVHCRPGRAGYNGTCDLCADGYRPNALPQSCTMGNTIEFSPVFCMGMTGYVCEYECDPGYSVGPTHRCGLQAFEGGFCSPNDCIEGLEIEHSVTVCAGWLGDNCTYECDIGYSVTGIHTCDRNREFDGGHCTPNSCYNGTRIKHSNTTCTGVTLDVCTYVCDPGFEVTGAHTCTVNGNYTGGSCEPIACTAGLMLSNSSTTCAGVTGDQCFYECLPGFVPGQPHVCEYDGKFRGGQCVIDRCTHALHIENSITICSPGFVGAVCEYECEPGHTPTGAHVCVPGGSYLGGECIPATCDQGLTLDNSPTTCSGVTSDRCLYACETGYEIAGSPVQPEHWHICNTTGFFAGGQCEQVFDCLETDPFPCLPDRLFNEVAYNSDGIQIRSDAVDPTDCRKNSADSIVTRAARTCACGRGFMEEISTRDARECFPWTECAYATYTAGYTSFAFAAALSTGSWVEYETVAPTSTTDRKCANATHCPEGKFAWKLPTDTMNTKCRSCPSGSYIANPSGFQPHTQCARCDPGFADLDTDASTPCTECPNGRFRLGLGHISCTACAANTYDNDTEPVTVCITCEVGYHSSPGATKCIPDTCTSGRRLEFSPTYCTGRTTDECIYRCNSGYTPTGDHVCGRSGSFRGGACVANPCTMGTYLDYSPTTCIGRTTEVCNYNCDPGYHQEGVLRCEPDGSFRGGTCEPNPCTSSTGADELAGTVQWGDPRELWGDPVMGLEFSNTSCVGVTGNECNFTCWPGYTETATHVCTVDGDFRGGKCTENPPERTFCVQCREGWMGKHGLCFGCQDGWEDVEPNQVECAPCLAGSAGLAGICEQCLYREKTGPGSNQTECLLCLDNEGVASKGQCFQCASGKRPNMTDPVSGSYWDIRNTLKDRGLPTPGTYSQIYRRLQEALNDETVGCVPCDAGKAGLDGFCYDCPPGTEPDTDLAACISCVLGHFSADGVACAVCAPGEGSNDRRSGCYRCPTNAIGVNGTCSECSTGQRPNAAQTSCGDCPIGFAGTDGFCYECLAGTQPDSGSGICEACGVGQFYAAPPTNIGTAAMGASVVVSRTQAFSPTSLWHRDRMIDGDKTPAQEDPGFHPGWAFLGGAGPSTPRSAIFTFRRPGGLQRVRLTSGYNYSSFHVTGLTLWATLDASPSLYGNWVPLEDLKFVGASANTTYRDDRHQLGHAIDGLVAGNEAVLDCYMKLEVTIVVRTKYYAADISWSMNGGVERFPNVTTDGSYKDNRVYMKKMWLPQGPHTFDFFDLSGFSDGWNGAYFEAFAADGTMIGGGENCCPLGVLRPGTNPVTSGSATFEVSEKQSIEYSNCSDTIELQFYEMPATGIRLDVIDTDLSTKNAIVNEVEIFATTVCELCADGKRVVSDRSGCEACPPSYAGVLGVCAECEGGQHPNAVQTACVDCPRGTAGVDGVCEDCSPGFEPNLARTECIACLAGHHSVIGDECVVCPMGTGVNAPRSGCEACPPGYIGVDGICSQCLSGRRDDATRGACEDCPAGEAGTEGFCAPCSLGTEVNPGSLTLADRLATRSFETDLPRTVCADCPLGMIRNTSDFRCITCRNGTEPNKRIDSAWVAFRLAANLKCDRCAIGWAGPFGVCKQCDSGQQPNGASVVMLPVLPKTPNMTAWLEACALSYLHEHNGVNFSLALEWPTIYKDDDPFADLDWQKWCQEVLLNSTGSDSWEDSSSWHGVGMPEPEPEVEEVPSLFLPSTYCHICPIGTAGVSGICAECAPGTQPNPELTECINCLPGYYSVVGEVCIICPMGTGTNGDQTGCKACPPGNIGVAGICSQCPSGWRDNAARGVCEHCPPGQAGTEGLCKPCPPGTEVDWRRQACTGCEKGTIKVSNFDQTLDMPLDGRLIASAWLLLKPGTYDGRDRVSLTVEDPTWPGRKVSLIDMSLAQDTNRTLVANRWTEVTADISGFNSADFKFSVVMTVNDWSNFAAPHNDSREIWLDYISIIAADTGAVVAFTSFEQPAPLFQPGTAENAATASGYSILYESAQLSSANLYTDILCDYCWMLDVSNPLREWTTQHRLPNRPGGNVVEYDVEGPAWAAGTFGAAWAGLKPGGYERGSEAFGFHTWCFACGLYDSDNVGISVPSAGVADQLESGSWDGDNGDNSWIAMESAAPLFFEGETALAGTQVYSAQDTDGTLEVLFNTFQLRKICFHTTAIMTSPQLMPTVGTLYKVAKVGSTLWEPLGAPRRPKVGDEFRLAAVPLFNGTGMVFEMGEHGDEICGAWGPPNALECKRCRPGTEPTLAADGCQPCENAAVGAFGQCSKCPTGRLPNSDRTRCEDCPRGRAGGGENGDCWACVPGSEPSAAKTECQDCATGRYSMDGSGCAYCPDGKRANAERIGCVQCPEGNFGVAGLCSKCTSGKAPNADNLHNETVEWINYGNAGYCVATGARYEVVDIGVPLNPQEAAAMAAARGAYLAVSTSREEDDCIASIVGGKAVWTGGVGRPTYSTIAGGLSCIDEGLQTVEDAEECVSAGKSAVGEWVFEPTLVSRPDFPPGCFAKGANIFFNTNFRAAVDPTRTNTREAICRLGADKSWSWPTGEVFEYVGGWATPTGEMTEPEPALPNGFSAYSYTAGITFNWAGEQDGKPTRPPAVDGGRWHACDYGCPWPHAALIEFGRLQYYTCVACPWGSAGIDGFCTECLPGTEVSMEERDEPPIGVSREFCVDCAPGMYKADNLRNVAALIEGGTGRGVRIGRQLDAMKAIDGIDDDADNYWLFAQITDDPNTEHEQPSPDGADGRPLPGNPPLMLWLDGNNTIDRFAIRTSVDMPECCPQAMTGFSVYYTIDIEPRISEVVCSYPPDESCTEESCTEAGHMWGISDGVYSCKDYETADHIWMPLEPLELQGNISGTDTPGNRVYNTLGWSDLTIVFSPLQATGLKIVVFATNSVTRTAALNEITVSAFARCDVCSDGWGVANNRTSCSQCPPNAAGVAGICGQCASGRMAAVHGVEVVPVGPSIPRAAGLGGRETVHDRTVTVGPGWWGAPTGATPDWHIQEWNASGQLEVGDGLVPVSPVNGLGPQGCRLIQRKYDDWGRYILELAPTAEAREWKFLYTGRKNFGEDTEAKITVTRWDGEIWTDDLEFWCTNWRPVGVDGNNTRCDDCPPGRAGIDGICEECGAGHQPNSDLSQCQLCGPGEYSPLGLVCKLCPGGSGANSFFPEPTSGCVDCGGKATGLVGNKGICGPCPSGTQPGGTEGKMTECFACPPGTSGVDGFCELCPPGYQPHPVGRATSCERCVVGKYKSEDLTECHDCWRNSSSWPEFTWCGCDQGFYLQPPIALTCDTTIFGSIFVPISKGVPVLAQLERGYDVSVSCPAAGCSMKEYEVHGSNPYTEDSTICASSIHATGRPSGIFVFRRDAWRGSPTMDNGTIVDAWPGTEANNIGTKPFFLTAHGLKESAGFILDDPNPRVQPACLDIDECAVDNGGCDMMTLCTNRAPGRDCGPCPSGYDGPLPYGGWAMGGVTSCIAVPPAADSEVLEAPQIPLLITGPHGALEEGSDAQIALSKQLAIDVALSIGLRSEEVHVESLSAASEEDRAKLDPDASYVRRLQADSNFMLKFINVPIKALVTVMTTRPAAMIQEINDMLADPKSLLRTSNIDAVRAQWNKASADSGGSGLLMEPELEKALVALGFRLNDAELFEHFVEIDTDVPVGISLKEIEKWWKEESVTQHAMPGQVIDADTVVMTCPPNTVSVPARDGEGQGGICTLCPAGWEYMAPPTEAELAAAAKNGSSLALSGDDAFLPEAVDEAGGSWQGELSTAPIVPTCSRCPSGQFNENDGGFCGFCAPGFEPNLPAGATVCSGCETRTLWHYSPKGHFCEQCEKTERSNTAQLRPAGFRTWPDLRVGCVCEAGRYNASRRPWPGPLVCVDSDGVVLGTAGSEFTPGSSPWCEICPKDNKDNLVGCIECDKDDSSADPVPGHWRAKPDAHRVYRCLGGTKSCPGGPHTPCIAPHDGIGCASCNPGFTPEDGGPGCDECPPGANLVPSVIALGALLGMISVFRWAEVQAGHAETAPTVADALSSAPPAASLTVISTRILISFLHAQWLLSRLQMLRYPGPMIWLLRLAGPFVDPATAITWSECVIRRVDPADTRGEGQLAHGTLAPVGGALLVALGLGLPGLLVAGGRLLRKLKRWRGSSRQVGPKEKVAEIFKKFDRNHDGLLNMNDVQALARQTGLEEYDEEAWEEWSSILKVADSGIGWTLGSFERWYAAREDGLKELAFTYARVFPHKSTKALSDAAVGGMDDDTWLTDAMNTWAGWAAIGLYVVHPMLAHHLLSVFSCADYEEGLSVMRSDRGVQCHTSGHVAVALFIVSPALWLFCQALPAVAVLQIRGARAETNRCGRPRPCVPPSNVFGLTRNCCARRAAAETNRGVKERLLASAKRQRESVALRFGFVLRGYANKASLWELVVAGRKAGLSFVVLFLEGLGPEPQVLAALLVVQLAALVQMYRQPYVAELPRRMEALSLAVTFITIAAAGYHHRQVANAASKDCAGQAPESEGYEPESAACGAQAGGELTVAAVTAAVVLANIALVATLLKLIVHLPAVRLHEAGKKKLNDTRAKWQKAAKKAENALAIIPIDTEEDSAAGRARKKEAKLEAARKKKAGDLQLSTAEQLEHKNVAITAGNKACKAMLERLGALADDLPELSPDVRAIADRVERLAHGLEEAKGRATAVQSQWNRGKLRTKFQQIAATAGDSSASVVGNGSKKYWETLFKRYDKDASGELDYNEFRRAVRLDAKIPTMVVDDDELKQIFDWVDVDRGGSISVEEFAAFLEAKENLTVEDEDGQDRPAVAPGGGPPGRRRDKVSAKYLMGARASGAMNDNDHAPDFGSIGRRVKLANRAAAGAFGARRGQRDMKERPRGAQGNLLHATPSMTSKALLKVALPIELAGHVGRRLPTPYEKAGGTPIAITTPTRPRVLNSRDSAGTFGGGGNGGGSLENSPRDVEELLALPPSGRPDGAGAATKDRV
jgi:Ca2+-binding EF-hand superfamily protein